MHIAYVVVALITAAANLFSGVCAVTRFEPVMRTLRPALATAGIPESWLVFPIGTLKIAGAIGVLAGLVAPPVGAAAAIGLVLYFVCAAYTHVRVGDYAPTFFLAIGFFLPLAVATLALNPAA